MFGTHLLPRLLLLLPLITSAEPDSDAVNERLPVRKSELESHWQVDCRGNWSAISAAAVGHDQVPVDCRFSPQQRRALELCAFIYQPPGEKSQHSCPDYRGLLRRLDAAETPDCGQLAQWLDTRMACEGNDHAK